jgi:hypothetical protein
VVAIDLFDELQVRNVSSSGYGSRAHFVRNMRAFFGDIAFLQCIAAPSNTLDPADLGQRFSFCHVDGGHTGPGDLRRPGSMQPHPAAGGVLALDDYFNPAFPASARGRSSSGWRTTGR